MTAILFHALTLAILGVMIVLLLRAGLRPRTSRVPLLLAGISILIMLRRVLLLVQAVGQPTAQTPFLPILSTVLALVALIAMILILRIIRGNEAGATSEAFLAAVVSSSDAAIIGTDLDGRIQSWNRGAEAIYGYTPAEAIGRPAAMTVPERLRAEFAGVLEAVKCGERAEKLESWRRRQSGEEFPVSATISPVVQAERVVGCVAVCHDRSEEKRIASKALQSQKLEAIGKLAGGIAHDFNNLIGGVQGYASMIVEQADGDPQVRRYADTIVRACKRASGLNRQLLAFSRQGKYLAVPVDMHALIRETKDLLEHTIDKRVEIELDLETERHTVMGDPAQLQNALLNLGINARDAMPDGGRVMIRTRQCAFDGRSFEGKDTAMSAGDYLRIDVADIGVGIPPEIVGDIFEPFFTTKAHGKGSGLGLAAVYGTMRHHSGAVEVKSTLGVGTTFTLFLPLGTPDIEHGGGDAAQKPVRGEGRILLVDDDEMVRQATGDFLRSIGYQVDVYAEAPAALASLARDPEAFDAVLLDVIMPKMNGRDALLAIRRIRREMPVVAISGYSDEKTARAMLDNGVLAFVEKPFSNAYLSRVVRDAVLESRHQRAQRTESA